MTARASREKWQMNKAERDGKDSSWVSERETGWRQVLGAGRPGQRQQINAPNGESTAVRHGFRVPMWFPPPLQVEGYFSVWDMDMWQSNNTLDLCVCICWMQKKTPELVRRCAKTQLAVELKVMLVCNELQIGPQLLQPECLARECCEEL